MKDPPNKPRMFERYVFAFILGLFSGLWVAEAVNNKYIKVPTFPKVKEPNSFHQEQNYVEPPAYFDIPSDTIHYSDNFYYVDLDESRLDELQSDWESYDDYVVGGSPLSMRLNL